MQSFLTELKYRDDDVTGILSLLHHERERTQPVVQATYITCVAREGSGYK